MSIRIAQKKRRGVAGDCNPTFPGVKNIDVTSGSMNKLNGRLVKYNFSPLLIGPCKDFRIFENYWQYGKIWNYHLDDNDKINIEWKRFNQSGKSLTIGKRHPLSREYGLPILSYYDGEYLEYIESRKKIYIPEYTKLISNTESMKALKEKVRNGEKIMILDVDGPPKSLYPEGVEMSIEFWNEMLENPKYPFGHGYVVAKLLFDEINK